MALRSWKFALAAGIACVLGNSTQAGLLPLSSTVVPDGDTYRYTYGVMLTSNSVLNPGDSFVIYDFNGLRTDERSAGPFAITNTGGWPDDPERQSAMRTWSGRYRRCRLNGRLVAGNLSTFTESSRSRP